MSPRSVGNRTGQLTLFDPTEGTRTTPAGASAWERLPRAWSERSALATDALPGHTGTYLLPDVIDPLNPRTRLEVVRSGRSLRVTVVSMPSLVSWHRFAPLVLAIVLERAREDGEIGMTGAGLARLLGFSRPNARAYAFMHRALDRLCIPAFRREELAVPSRGRLGKPREVSSGFLERPERYRPGRPMRLRPAVPMQGLFAAGAYSSISAEALGGVPSELTRKLALAATSYVLVPPAPSSGDRGPVVVDAERFARLLVLDREPRRRLDRLAVACAELIDLDPSFAGSTLDPVAGTLTLMRRRIPMHS